MTPKNDHPVQIASLATLFRTAEWHLSLLHSAPSPRAIWITHGQGRVILGPRRYGIGVHNFLFLPADQPMSLTPGAAMNGHIITLPPNADAPWPVEPYLLRLRDAGSQADISMHVEAILRESREDQIHADHAMHHSAGQIAIWLHRQIIAQNGDAQTSTASDRLLAAYLEDLERHFPKGLLMADYAERLDVTPTHLSRVCKSRLGHSAAALISQRSLHAARTALEDSQDPIQDIAAKFGFGSAASFSRFIQTQTGHAPSALRKRPHR